MKQENLPGMCVLLGNLALGLPPRDRVYTSRVGFARALN